MGVITVQQALASGMSRDQIRARKYRALLRGAYWTGEAEPGLRDYVQAVRLVVPGAVVTGETALALYGFGLRPPFPLCVATPRRCRRGDLRVVARREEHGTRAVAPLPVALRDANLTLAERVASADLALRRGRLSRAQLMSVGLASVAELVSARAESVKESQARVVMVLAGLPAPQEQVVVRDDGGEIGRVDFAWPDYRVVAEYEGQQHATDSAQWRKDIRRYERLTAAGWHVIRVTADDLRHPLSLATRIYAALHDRGYRGPKPALRAKDLADLVMS